MRRAIIPGTFDPITYGHLDVIKRAAQLFDEVTVGVAASAGKHPIFDLEKRTILVREAIKDIENANAEPFGGLLVDFARAKNAQVLVKGLRAITDFEYEFQMAALNYELGREIETVFIMSPPQYMYLSSSIVRELASLHSSVEKFVPVHVARALEAKFA